MEVLSQCLEAMRATVFCLTQARLSGSGLLDFLVLDKMVCNLGISLDSWLLLKELMEAMANRAFAQIWGSVTVVLVPGSGGPAHDYSCPYHL